MQFHRITLEALVELKKAVFVYAKIAGADFDGVLAAIDVLLSIEMPSPRIPLLYDTIMDGVGGCSVQVEVGSDSWLERLLSHATMLKALQEWNRFFMADTDLLEKETLRRLEAAPHHPVN